MAPKRGRIGPTAAIIEAETPAEILNAYHRPFTTWETRLIKLEHNASAKDVLYKTRDKKYWEEEAKELVEWSKCATSLWIGTFCMIRGYSKDALVAASDKHEVLKTALDYARNCQEARLVENALRGAFNPTMTRSVLIECHNWTVLDRKSDENVLLEFLRSSQHIDLKPSDSDEVQVDSDR